MNVNDVVTAYLAHEGTRGNPRTFEDRRHVLGLFAAEFGPVPVPDLRPHHLLLWLPRHPEWKSDWTLRRVAATVHRPFSWARKLGLTEIDPFAGIGYRTGERGRPMTDGEYAQLSQTARLPFRRILTFLRWTGARPGEARALEWPCIDVEAGVATLLDHKTARQRRDHAPRLIALSLPVVQLLIDILEGCRDETPTTVFLNEKGRAWTRNAFALQMGRLRAKCGLPLDCRLYGLRHRFGTIAAASGVDLKGLAELLGHTTTRMTEHYIHLRGRADILQARLRDIEGL